MFIFISFGKRVIIKALSEVFSRIHRKIKVLRKNEIFFLKTNLESYDRSFGDKVSKRKLLLEYFVENTQFDPKLAIKHVYGKESIGVETLRGLAKSLEMKIDEALISDINVRRKNANDNFAVNVIQTRKDIIAMLVYLGRGLTKDGLVLMENIIYRCKKFELYDELTQVLFYKKELSFLKRGSKDFEKANLELQNVLDLKSNIITISDYYQRLNIRDSEIIGYKPDMNELNLKLIEFEKIVNNSNSYSLAFPYYKLKIYQSEKLEKYDEAILVCNKWRKHLLIKKEMARDVTVGMVYNNLANLHLLQFDFEKALKSGDDALNLLRPKTFSYFTAVETMFYASFYLGKKIKTAEYLEYLKLDKSHESQIKRNKIKYFEIAYEVFFGKSKSSLKWFSEIEELDNDLEGWNFWIRVTQVIASYKSNGDLEILHSHIDSLRQFVGRVDRKKAFNERHKIIYKILFKLEYAAFDFNKAYKRCEKELNILENLNDKKTRWRARTPEIKPFHEWFKEEMEEQKNQKISGKVVKR